MMEAERDIVAGEMARHDVDADAVVIAGKVHRRVLRQSQTYMTSAGEVVVERTLYQGQEGRRRALREPDRADARHRRRFLDAARCAPRSRRCGW